MAKVFTRSLVHGVLPKVKKQHLPGLVDRLLLPQVHRESGSW